MSEESREGCQMILVDREGRVLLQLRDDIPTIAYPGMWALPGGMLDRGETPAECILREMREEMGLELPASSVQHLATRHRSYGVEHTFTARTDFDVARIDLTEGQAIRWFAPDELARTGLAYEDDAVLAEFGDAARERPADGEGSADGR